LPAAKVLMELFLVGDVVFCWSTLQSVATGRIVS
jgi:hypothetical protein